MKILHFDNISGIAGDMAMGALLHLGAGLDPLVEALQAMQLQGVGVSKAAAQAHGIGAIQFIVKQERKDYPHRSWQDIRGLIKKAGLPASARERAEGIFKKLAEAEALVHETDPEDIVFHEVGAVDSIADIVGCALAIDQFCPDQITSSPPVLGRGVVQSQHGPIPVPAPATLELLKSIPTRGLDIEGELTTPTGAAILASQVDKFTAWPSMVITKIGYGVGSKVFEGRPNVLRVVLGESPADQGDEFLVEANIDDMSPEMFEYLIACLFEAGAHDVWLQPVVMKKSRPAVTLAVLCDEKRLDSLERIIFIETTTIGLRRQKVERRKLSRRQESVQTDYGPVRIKIAGEGGEIWTASPEHDDCIKLAQENKVPLKTVYLQAMKAWKS
ncbi:MAG: nickel pincer cofactor biosynthesis protein LarC [Deltaproteobacteria bacterium]|nr:nickel pincer cofactor biosynthesis protein LarC [Deltaproteobacteria bacterium]